MEQNTEERLARRTRKEVAAGCSSIGGLCKTITPIFYRPFVLTAILGNIEMGESARIKSSHRPSRKERARKPNKFLH